MTPSMFPRCTVAWTKIFTPASEAASAREIPCFVSSLNPVELPGVTAKAPPTLGPALMNMEVGSERSPSTRETPLRARSALADGEDAERVKQRIENRFGEEAGREALAAARA